jgi:hypothetical protein
VDSFAGIGNAKAVNKALERLVKSGALERAATGVYVRPVTDGHLGKVLPGPEDIAAAIAKRDRATIVPTGSYAMYKLGLTTQVPLNLVYYTDASARKIKVGKQVITFKKASAKYLSFIGGISQLAIQALREIGQGRVTAQEVAHLKKVLENEQPGRLEHDLRLAPVWIRKLMTAHG